MFSCSSQLLPVLFSVTSVAETFNNQIEEQSNVSQKIFGKSDIEYSNDVKKIVKTNLGE